MKKILSKKIPLIYVVGIFILAIATTFGFTNFVKDSKETSESTNPSHFCNIKVKRLNGYHLVKPIMFADEECPSDNMALINESINNIISNYKQYQNVTSASVYLRDFESTEWTVHNEGEQYEPGSLFKVPILVALLKMNEEKPGLLDKKIPYTKIYSIDKKVMFESKSIELGKQYSVRELLKYMIVYSDNNATALLETILDYKTTAKMFTDLGLTAPDFKADNYYFTVRDYSLFMRAIYNASYLNSEDSEYAAQLLTQTQFKDGIINGLPSGTVVAHKFGESGHIDLVQLHESAIVYLNDNAYLLTVMTKGKDMKTLSKLIAEISKTVYNDRMNKSISSI
jgi:beta-lactamase class A